MAFWDDLTEFGSGLLDDVGEGLGNIINNFTADDSSTNAGTVQQPHQPVKDNHGNAVTGSLLPNVSDNTLMYVGGGLAVAALVTLFVMKTK